jgi:flagella basal body P-ring formation protein FlgA
MQGGLEIALSAIALQAGAAGDVVRLRNADSGSIFAGTVMEDGTVRVSSS